VMPGYPQAPTETPPTLTLVAFPDPVVERFGHRPGSPYVEFVWLGILGPSTTFAWQRLARQAAAMPSSKIDITDLSVSLGLGESLARNAWCRARLPGSSHSMPRADKVTPWRFASRCPTYRSAA
jgi:hypothetical protein